MLAPGRRAGPRPRAGGWDRCRVGERLSAARAGLQELRVLRERQRALVRGALDAQSPPSPDPLPAPEAPEAPARDPCDKEPRLEATLAALKEQLSWLRRQDAGLKAHLEQLGQQISALRLDMRETASEPRDGDSRPSSGFYELSEGGSRSLSTSCTSVSSSSVSSSLSSSLPRGQLPSDRPRSADETTAHAAGPPARRPPALERTPLASGTGRPRPVSTGDLERAAPTAMGLQDARAKPSSPPGCAKDAQSPVLDPKYQSDLVSRSGREVYLYPSPLHAVALQSPLFAPAEAATAPSSSPHPHQLGPGTPGPSLTGTRPTSEAGTAGAYIERLLQLARGRGRPCGGAGTQQVPPRCGVAAPQLKRRGQGGGHAGQVGPLACSVGSEGEGNTAGRGSTDTAHCVPQGPGSLADTQHPTVLPEEFTPCSSCTLEKSPAGLPWSSCGPGPAPCPQVRQPLATASCWKVRATSPSWRENGTSPAPAPGRLPQAQAVASAVRPPRLRTGKSRAKAAKVKKRASDEALRHGKPHSPSPERQRGVHAVHWLPTIWDLPHGRPGAGRLWRGPRLAAEARGRSCSESSLCPVPFLVPLVLARQEGCQALAMGPFEATQLTLAPDRGTCKKQRKWRSTVEISTEARLASCPSLRPLCARARPQPPRHGPHTPGASLCHSTITETSEEDASDHTASRFGDGESSDGDLEGCGPSSGDGRAQAWGVAGVGGLVWPPLAPATPRAPVSPAPKLCRIKASRALRKRLRRFPPAAWKVMTMV
ncbi:dapper homolog 2 [Tamandua tetradactyla]|uniref:dapper homolog 2 n=1 Tax=Tamandua tetradactyla TaxID=48850 RepID=UPI004053B6F1